MAWQESARSFADAVQWVEEAPVHLVLDHRAGDLVTDLGLLSSTVAGVSGDQVIALRGHQAHEGTRAAWLADELSLWETLSREVQALSAHFPQAPLPGAVSLSTDLWALLLGADHADLLDLLMHAAPGTPAVQVRDEGADWRTCNESETMSLLGALHVAIIASLTVTVVVRRPEPQSRQVTWLLCRDGWREVCDGAPGIQRLVRRNPAVLTNRIHACLPRPRGAAA